MIGQPQNRLKRLYLRIATSGFVKKTQQLIAAWPEPPKVPLMPDQYWKVQIGGHALGHVAQEHREEHLEETIRATLEATKRIEVMLMERLPEKNQGQTTLHRKDQ